MKCGKVYLRKNSHHNFIQLAAPVLQRLESAGFEAYLVGGCVREALRDETLREKGLRDEALRGEAQRYPAAKATDIDVTTNALPGEICQVFSDMPVIETGIQHGTVTVLVPAPAPAAAGNRIPIEITTYRTDGTYSDGRHPDQVQFVTSLEEDLARRDFTVNAMAMDLRGNLEDPFGGRTDLEQGIIRAVGEPDTRFQEDALRILRALRFAATLTKAAQAHRVDSCLPASGSGAGGSQAKDFQANDHTHNDEAVARGFQIDSETAAALFRCAPMLQRISAERVFAELKKLVCGPAAGEVIRHYVDILAVVIPELMPMKGFNQNNPYHNYDVLEHCIRAMEVVQTTPSGEAAQTKQLTYMKLAALLHDIGKPKVYTEDKNGIGHFYTHPQVGAEIVRKILSRLRADRFTTERITTLVRCHDLVFQEDDRLLKRWMNRYTPQILLEILELKRADNIATGNVSQDLLDKFDRIKDRIRGLQQEAKAGQTCFCMKDLAVSGQDLIDAGIPEGPEIGNALRALLAAVIDGELPNERDALLAAVASGELSNEEEALLETVIDGDLPPA